MKNAMKNIKPFVTLTLCYIVFTFALKLIEIFFVGGISEISSFSGMIYGNLTSSCFISLLILIIYLIVSIFSRKSATFTAALLFSMMFIFEAGLIIYHKSTGILMGNELINRPLWETWFTIKSVLNLWIILATIATMCVYVFISVKLSKKDINKIAAYITLLLICVFSISFFITKPKQDKFIVNKISYCINACLEKEKNGQTLSKLEYDKDKINTFWEIYPDREVTNNDYPIERKDNIGNVLGPYFKTSDKKPNVVIIVVESLGANIFGENEYGISFTPFLDSLSKHSLYWSNCLSTTPRSFGAVPAITGSVPHGTMGFQFGDIPEYNSLFSVLKSNNYMTSAFYAGEFSFDKVYDYLISQQTDFLAPFFEDQKKKENKKYDYTYWGYQDMVMFDKSMDIIEQRDMTKSYFDLFITISQHDNRLRLNDKERADVYYDRAAKLIAKYPESLQAKKNEITGYLAAALYGDESIKHFIKRYTEFDKDGNTIFIITGDHSLNQNPENALDAFHVPLIIWSPMLENSQHFKAVVSHNDITPSLNALMRDNFNMDTPKNIHWMGQALDTTADFHCDIKTCFFRYTRKIFDGVYNNYYYTFENNRKQLFLIKDNLELEKIDDKNLIDEINEKFQAMIYVDNYSYSNNMMTKTPLFPHSKFEIIESYSIDSVYCATSQEKPGGKKQQNVDILSDNIRGQHKEIKIIITADILYTGNVWQDQFINLGVEYNYDGNNKITQYDNISKNITTTAYHPNEWLKLEFVKIFYTKDFEKNKFDIYLRPTEKDFLWDPKHTVTLKNINITVLGSELD